MVGEDVRGCERKGMERKELEAKWKCRLRKDEVEKEHCKK